MVAHKNMQDHSLEIQEIVVQEKPLKEDEEEDASVAHLSYWKLFVLFLEFGVNAWGGPMAQINMLREELVERRKWITNNKFMKCLVHLLCSDYHLNLNPIKLNYLVLSFPPPPLYP